MFLNHPALVLAYCAGLLSTCYHLEGSQDLPTQQLDMTAVGFEPTPLRNGALSHRLRPLGHTALSPSGQLGAQVRIRLLFYAGRNKRWVIPPVFSQFQATAWEPACGRQDKGADTIEPHIFSLTLSPNWAIPALPNLAARHIAPHMHHPSPAPLEHIVAIDVARARFPADALWRASWAWVLADSESFPP